MPFINWIRTNALIALCCILLAVQGLIGALLYDHRNEQQLSQQAERYGTALAQSIARSAIEPAMAQDMISLQAILQAATIQNGILGATVHDVENRLLVQSGEVTPEHAAQEHPSFTAPITFNEHIAGYLTITLNLRSQSQKQNLFVWIWFGVTGMFICALWVIRSMQSKEVLTDEPEALNSPTHKEPSATAIIELSLLNITQLHEQLSHDIFNERLEQLDQRLKDILALYTGFKYQFAHNRLSLRVEADSLSNASFHAVCISQLILRLNEKSITPKFKIATAITTLKKWKNSDAILQGYLTGVRPEQKLPAIWVDPQLHDNELLQKVTLDNNHQLHTINSPYCDLLQRQEQQLANLINHH